MGPLTGVKVVDLTHALAGPYCTMMLADMGAEVIKVESAAGDVTRAAGPFSDDDELRAFGGYFQSVNRGKSSVVLDLKSKAGADTLRALAAEADILVENFTPGVMDRLGLSYDELSAANPRLVYAALSGFGNPRSGVSPYQDWPAFDIVVQAMAGLMSVTGTEDGTPIKVGPGVGDIFPGALLALGIVSALYEARVHGAGQFVDVAMYDSVLSLCERIVYQYSYTGRIPVAEGNKHPLLSPFDILPAADGWVAVAAPNDNRWAMLCDLIGRSDLIDHPDFRTNAERVAHRGDTYQVLSDWTRSRTRAQIAGLMGGKVPVGDVCNAAEILAGEQVAARHMAVELEHPGTSRKLAVAGQPIKFSRTTAGPVRRAPMLDEHGEAIRSRYSRAQASTQATHLDREVADIVSAIEVPAVPADVLAAATDCIIDTIAVTFGAHGADEAADIRGIVTTPGDCSLIGVRESRDVRSAALVNGTAAHLLDFDDWLADASIHPSAPLLPAVLAQAEAAGATGDRLLAGFIAGFEGQARIGASLSPAHYASGFHQTATVGCFGAAIGATRIISSDPRMAERALGFAATSAAGLRRAFGTAAKSLQVGRAAEAGVFAAQLAASPMSAPVDGVFGPQGFVDAHGHQGRIDLATLSVSQRWFLRDVLNKRHASCFGTHAVIDCMLELRTRCDHASVAEIQVAAAQLLSTVCAIEDPQTALEAKFSIAFTAALAMVRGHCTATDFDPSVVSDPLVRELASRVRIRFDPALRTQQASVTVVRTDGTTLSTEADSARVPAAATRSAVAREKFALFAAPLLGDTGAVAALRVIEDLADGRPVADLSEALMPNQ
ncbi:CoA transferase [Nocardia sp. NPDC059228]|uniref:CoA transferase n=1 Tax=Nocardia sp. NPDC059228 TaxID=3346777 RepID=UPI0036801084